MTPTCFWHCKFRTVCISCQDYKKRLFFIRWVGALSKGSFKGDFFTVSFLSPKVRHASSYNWACTKWKLQKLCTYYQVQRTNVVRTLDLRHPLRGRPTMGTVKRPITSKKERKKDAYQAKNRHWHWSLGIYEPINSYLAFGPSTHASLLVFYQIEL